MTIEAVDALSPITTIEYRVNQVQEWTETELDGDELSAELQRQFGESGFQYVEFRATDEAGNVSDIGTVAFSVVGACTYARSDEFDGTALDDRWLRHTRNGGTPTDGRAGADRGRRPADDADARLRARLEPATTAVGPVNFLGQDLPRSAASGRSRRSSRSTTPAAGSTRA